MSAITPYLNQTVSVTPETGHDADGASTYGTPYTVRARVEQRKRLVRNDLGEQLVSDMQVFLEPDAAVSEGDSITYEGAYYEVLSVTKERALESVSHLVAWTGRSGRNQG